MPNFSTKSEQKITQSQKILHVHKQTTQLQVLQVLQFTFPIPSPSTIHRGAFFPRGPKPQHVPATTARATAWTLKRVGATKESSQSLLEVSLRSTVNWPKIRSSPWFDGDIIGI
jgi:hypothetical protein